MALPLVLGGCGRGPVGSAAPGTSTSAVSAPARNAPASGEYLLESSDKYYADLRATLPTVTDARVRANLERLLRTPVAEWLARDLDVTVGTIRQDIARAHTTESIPMFVAYGIPGRDLHGESGGGQAGADAYKQWIQGVSDTIGTNSAIVILEPDALPHATEMNDADRATRLALLGFAYGQLLQHNPATAVYVDVGNSTWVDPGRVADLLRAISPNQPVAGISLNVANRRPEAEIRSYAARIEQAYGHQLYVMIDSSVNGAPNTAALVDWCNPHGQKVGTLPSTRFDRDALVEHAFIKTPGQSDGRCGTSDQPAGEFDRQLLLDQLS
ncbi:glycoside hydrolase family 6 protein [Nocardia sp. CDC153]|uniref:glycoside hydrolase family 6 protein n=1 Tax=Nocardia sp. CDC153 TaxID=3112167 RepID=UPI002DBEB6C9|nr:glycoside hydrolase family 6 protein [Nocardia sp. CDC153]MEC3953617.1 glycoside hydrolase family 6 protein [Nocardia sp. CDC153]